MKNIFNFNIIATAAITALVVSSAFKSTTTVAQSTPSLSGTFGCITNTNIIGFVTASTGSKNSVDINDLYMMTFDSATGKIYGMNTRNYVNAFETSSASNTATVYTFALSSTTLSFTQDSNSPYVYNIVDSRNPSYSKSQVALVNGGNTLLVLGEPTTNAAYTGVCQKV